MTTSDKWTRRKLLAGGAGAALLPFVPVLEGDALAQSALPKRLIVWFYPNGTLPGAYFPTTTGDQFEITPILEPLAPHRNDIIVLKGIRLNAYDDGVQVVHISCVTALLTGYTMAPGNMADLGIGWAAGPSVDQVVARALAADPNNKLTFPSLEFHNVGAVDQNGPQYRVIYQGLDQPITGERDPRAAFMRIFGGNPGADADAERLKKSRLNVIDRVNSNLVRLRQRIGAADRFKLDAHLEAIAALQKRVNDGWGSTCAPQPIVFEHDIPTGSCGVNDSPSRACALDNYYPELGKLNIDLMVQALACGDVTRVMSLQWGAGGRGSYFKFLEGGGDNEHLVSHLGNSDPQMNVTSGIYMRIKRWYMEQLAYLISQLKTIPEGDGTLFDNTMILACSEHGVGAEHSPDNIPFLIAGGGWHFKTGRYLTYQDSSNNDLLLSVCQAMGLPLTTFGDPKYCTGPLSGLT